MSDDETPAYTKGHNTTKSLKAHMELDYRRLIDGPSGVFFKEKIITAGLGPRLGGDDWWYEPGFVSLFKQNISHNKKTGAFILKVGPRKVAINADYISRLTGLRRNPSYKDYVMERYSNLGLFTDSKILAPMVHTVAPYIHADHWRPVQNAFKTKGLQENQSLVAKWFTTNFLGIQTRHLVDSRTAWFLRQLSEDTLLVKGWCPCVAILHSLHSAVKTGAYPLPFLMTKIWAHENGIRKENVAAVDLSPPERLSEFMKVDIPGFWTGKPITDEATRPRALMTFDAWVEWKSVHGPANIGGGWMYDNRNRLLGPSTSDRSRPSSGTSPPVPMDIPIDAGQSSRAAGDVEGTTAAHEAEGSRAVSRRRGREEPISFGDAHAPTLPYTYRPVDGPHTYYDPSVQWPVASYMDPGVASRVAPQHHGEVILRRQDYMVYGTFAFASLHLCD